MQNSKLLKRRNSNKSSRLKMIGNSLKFDIKADFTPAADSALPDLVNSAADTSAGIC